MIKKEGLDLEIRRKIYTYIVKSPGLHERALARELDLPLSTLDYHLYYLKKRDLLHASSDGRYTRYYPVGKIGVKDKKVLALLRQSVPRRIVLFLLLNPNSSHGEIGEHARVAPSTTSFHLKKLTELQIISREKIGMSSLYTISEPEYISDILISYKKSFLDKAVDQFIGTWLELHPRSSRKTKKKDKDNDREDTFIPLLFLS